MNPLPILDFKYEYSIAGLCVLTNRPAEPGKDNTGTDGVVKVVFLAQEANLAEFADSLRISEDQGEWYPCVDYKGIAVIIRHDGKIILIRDRDNIIRDYPAFLRQMIPFAAALQNKLVLHASAVRINEGIVAFIGGSGAGKSTLARHFRELGFGPVADDLMPVHIGPQGALISLAGDTKISPKRVPLARIYFLSRDASLKRMKITALSKMEHLMLQLEHGYSELSIAKIWRMQFASYSRIVEMVDASQLILPDDINYLDEAVKILSGGAFAVGETAHTLSANSLVERSKS